MSDPPTGLRRPRPLPLAGVVAAVILVSSSAASAQPEQSRLELEPCHLDHIAHWAECGSYEVPEDETVPDSRRITLRVAVLPSFAQPAEPDPVFLLAGGPGRSAVAMAAPVTQALGPVNRNRDIVLIDQRGTGQSSPLDCAFDFDQGAFDQEAKTEAVRDCLAGLDADPSRYGTIDHVRDLEAVRRALGYERINLYGTSYGTRVAQVYIREYPESLRAAVMDAVISMETRVGLEMGADAQLALDGVFHRCETDRDCGPRFPDLRRQLEGVLADLEANPRELELTDPVTGAPERIRMDEKVFALGLRAQLYHPQTQRLVPWLIDRAAHGDWTGLVGLTSAVKESQSEVMTEELLLAVLCSEDLADVATPEIPARERASLFGTALIDEFLGYCTAWPQPARRVDWNPARSDQLPVLLLSGALDPVTPPYRADEVAATLGNSRHLIVTAGGHTVGDMGCIPELIARFIESRDPEGLDASCIDDLDYPSFFVSALGPTP